MTANKHKAAVTLAIAAIGSLASYPFHDSFAGGLMAAVCTAALIGGLADWFAVAALFKKPLGIPFRTAVIPRKKQKIFQSIITIVEQELLTKHNILRTLDDYNPSAVILHYMNEHGGSEAVKKVLIRCGHEIIKQLDEQQLAKAFNSLMGNQGGVRVAPLLAEGAERLFKKGYDGRIINFIVDQLAMVVDGGHFKNMLADMVSQAQKTYERGMTRRRFFNQLINLNPDKTAEAILQALKSFLLDFKNDDNHLRAKLRDRFHFWLLEVRHNQELQTRIEGRIKRYFYSADADRYTGQFVAEIKNTVLADTDKAQRLLRPLTVQVDKLLNNLEENPQDQHKLNTFMKKAVAAWMDEHHGEIGKLVYDNLNKFTDQMLVEFIENKVGNDLQMIRINGSVVGGAAGAVVYLFQYWLGIV